MSTEPEAAWPDRLLALMAARRATSRGPEADRALGELWQLLNLVLQGYARRHARGLGRFSREDLREIAAEKTSELLVRLDSAEWDPSASSPVQICGFLAVVARNGVVDFHRVRRRESAVDEPDTLEATQDHASPEAAVDSATYARTILDCSAALTPRARRAWLLRILYELDSADIARDPEVASTPAGVDAMLARCRERMRACLERKGLPTGPLPQGTFVRLWDMIGRRGRG